MMSNRFEERYKTGNLPWDIKRPDRNLIETIREYDIAPGHALDVGCGTGDNVFWMIENGFNATGIDYSPSAIEHAREKAQTRQLNPEFYVVDVLKDKIPGAPYDFVFDRGCFHSFDKQKERNRYAANVHQVLKESGHWLSLIGSVDDGRLDFGPPKRKASEIVKAVEPYFEILSLKQSHFDSDDEVPSKIWVCLMKKR
ncbi:MAG: class I SAM-dependent methyltransferase [Bacteroidetes bacterium]|nr:class I SAM-dependent methyltransferase [Bacteroidota bacterium]